MTRVGTAPTSYFGGKQQLAPRIVALFPSHDTYCEPFFGAGAVFFTKPPSALEIINDADELIVNFFRVLRDPTKGARLREALELTPYAREEWAECRLGVKRAVQMNWRDAADDVELARRWFVLTQMSFAGRISGGARVRGRDDRAGHGAPGHENTGWRYTTAPGHNPAMSFRSAITRLPQFTTRLAYAQIEHDDALSVIQRYDGPRALMYLDPPYEPSTRSGGGYAHEMSAEDHRRLLDLITAPNFRSMVVLSGYDSALYRERLEVALPPERRWQRLEVTVACSAAGRTRAGSLQGKGAVYAAGQTRTEVLWLNPAAQRRQGLWAGLTLDDETDSDDFDNETATLPAAATTPSTTAASTPSTTRDTRQRRKETGRS